MKIKITACLYAAVIIAMVAGPALARQTEIVREDSLVITATKTAKDIDGITASVDVITQEDIKLMGASTLKNIMEKTPGLTLQYGQFAHSSAKSKSTISIRGMGGNGTLLLIDGRRMAGETQSTYELDRIPAGMIERIEIVKGPMSTLYGSDALGGVINIITKKAGQKKFAMDMDLSTGMNDHGDGESYKAGVNAWGRVGKVGITLYTNYNKTRPYRETETYSSKALNPKTGLPVTSDPQHGETGNRDVTYRDESEVFSTGISLDADLTERLNAQLGLNYFEENRDGTYTGGFKKARPGQTPSAVMVLDTPVDSEDDNNRLDANTSVKYKFTDTLTGRIGVYRSEYEKRNKTRAKNFTAPTNTKFSADVDITGYEAESTWAVTSAHLLVGGAEYREISRNSAAINPDPASYAFVNDTQLFKAVYLQDEWQITPGLNAIFGARYDDMSDAENKATFKAGLVKQFSPMLKVRVNYAEGYRAPDTAELYVVAPTPGDIPRIGAEAVYGTKTTVHELDPEFLRSYELGIGGNYQRFSYEIVLFYNDVSDKIEIQRVDADGDGSDDYQTYVNKQDVDIKGLELNLGYDFGHGVTTDFTWTELSTEDGETGNDLLYNPERTLSLGVNYQAARTLSFSLTARHIGSQHKSQTDKADAYELVDISFLKLFGTRNQYELYGGVNNIFGESVDKSLGSNMGPYIFAGMRVHF
ncbi:MAG: TonB-dependent receptor [Desulfobacterales bacterium]|nr:TonB-dependent receptor [Desulfobacterales bacterium]